MIHRDDISIDRNRYGAIVLSAFVGPEHAQWLETKQYYDYTEDEALDLFLAHCREVEAQ